MSLFSSTFLTKPTLSLLASIASSSLSFGFLSFTTHLKKNKNIVKTLKIYIKFYKDIYIGALI